MKKIMLSLLIAFTTITLFAQGYYIEMKMTSDKQGFSGNMKAYFQDNNTRSEITVTIPELGSTMNFATLTLASTPNVIYMIDEKKKTYSEVKTDADATYKDYPQTDYEITVLGKETVNGYNTVHVSVKNKSTKTTEEMWMTKDIADFSEYAKMKSKYTGKDNLNKALEAKGAGGFPVRIKTVEQGMNIQLDVVKTEKRSNPAAYFTLDGYTKGGSTGGLPAGVDVQELMKNMQNMTPEQREALQKQLEQQYKPK